MNSVKKNGNRIIYPAEIEREEDGEIKQDQTAEDLSSKVKKWWDELDLGLSIFNHEMGEIIEWEKGDLIPEK